MALDGVARAHLPVFAACVDERGSPASAERETDSFDTWLPLTPLLDAERVALRDWLRAVLDGNHACWLVEAPLPTVLDAWRAVSYASGDTAPMEAALAWRVTTGTLLPAEAEAAMAAADDAGHLSCRVEALRAVAVAHAHEKSVQKSYLSMSLLSSCWPCVVPTQVRTLLDRVPSVMTQIAAALGSVPLLMWVREQAKDEYLLKACAAAARGGHLAALQWLRARDCPWEGDTLLAAATGGHLDVLVWAHEHGCEWYATVPDAAAASGHLHILAWMHAKGFPWDEDTTAAAAGSGHLSVLQWLRARGCPWDYLTTSDAAVHGHMHVLQWAHDNGCALPGAKACRGTASRGHLHALKWLHEHGCAWNAETTMAAAGNGHLEVLQYAVANGCPWDARVCAYATVHGHFEVLKWAHEHGCPWDESTCTNAASTGNLPILQWVRERGCPWDCDTTELAYGQSHLEVLMWASSNGCPARSHVKKWLNKHT